MRFRTRRMEVADETQFNEVYNSLVAGTKAPRPLEVMRRVWHDGPGGPALSWLVEAQDERGAWRLVGHHGLCPIRFTLGREDLLFAKTINTFLLPEFRNKFLYLRFEQHCLAEAEGLFDATYSLAGHAARIRGGLGYDTSVMTLDFEQGLQPPGIFSQLLVRVAGRYPHFPLPQFARLWGAIPAGKSSPIDLAEHSAETAASSSFFASFWDEARMSAGLAPRRDIADLAWRFWNMPDKGRTTLAHAWSDGVRAFCIVNRPGPFHVVLEDIFLTSPQPERLQQFLDAIFAWCRAKGALVLRFMTTMDSQPPILFEVYSRNMGISLSRKHRNDHMSRRLTVRGQERLGAKWPPCNITGIVGMA